MIQQNHIFLLPALDYLRLRFHLKACQDCKLPFWKGSLLRGAFGHSLKRTVCIMRQGQVCEHCDFRSRCAYTEIFETFVTENPPGFLGGQVSSPRPFIFEPQDTNKNYQADDILWFDLIMIGKAYHILPYIIWSVYQMGVQGLGANRYPFQLESTYCYQPEEQSTEDSKQANQPWVQLYDGATQMMMFNPKPTQIGNSSLNSDSIDNLKLKFVTQTRLKFRNELTMDFSFRMLVFKMIRRALELAYFYTDQKDFSWEFHDLLEAADKVQITKRNLHWQDWERYSNRQKSKMKLGGFVGDMVIQGDLTPFMDLLAYSEVLHVGKGATFGLGKMECQNTDNA